MFVIKALGVIAFVLLCGCLPFDDDSSRITSESAARKKFALRFPRFLLIVIEETVIVKRFGMLKLNLPQYTQMGIKSLRIREGFTA
jgi:hypothetical protein